MIERTTVPVDQTWFVIAFAILLLVMLIGLWFASDDPNF